uniref:Uncharacterized protein n=1 Tax=Cannabis sativa TaxID=3483 RepID=A0A803PS90_CANSA
MVLTIIRGHRLEGFLNGLKPCPPEFLPSKNKLAKPVISTGICDKSATTIEDLYGAHSRANMEDLRTKLTTVRKGSQSMTNYLKQKRLWVDTLALAGEVMTIHDKLLRGNVLSDLCAEYLTIVVPLEVRSTLSWEELSSTLLSFDSKLERLTSLSTNSKQLENLTANIAQKPYGLGFNSNHDRGI